MSTLQERLLRTSEECGRGTVWSLLTEAAERIAALEAALEQAARICDEFQRQHGDSDNHGAFLALRIRTLAREVQGC